MLLEFHSRGLFSFLLKIGFLFSVVSGDWSTLKKRIVFSGYGMLQSEMKEKLKITVSSGDFKSFGKVY
jgi:hypothetical protein